MTTIETTILGPGKSFTLEARVTLSHIKGPKEAALAIAAFERVLIQARAEDKAITVEELAKRLGVRQ